VNRGQELVVGGYLPGTHGLDSIIVGYYKDDDLIYVARVRNGFVPASRRQMFEKVRSLVIPDAQSSTCRRPIVHVGVRG
jgi:ATP-dependent DNA ligase